ncbi:HlyC/CorC family transporter [Candidatus Dependentiae bacterium]|nr:MAG: HlyC/CorC family transporter [Candidatus Dependentiae bacterium]
MELHLYNTLYIPIILFFISLFACALYSFLETSVTALRLFKLKELSQKVGGRYKTLFHVLEENPQHILITILIANSLASVTSAVLITSIMEGLFVQLKFSGGLGFSVGIGLATTAILIFGEIIPKNIAKTRGERLFRSTLFIVNATYYLFYPFARFLTNFSNMLIYKLGNKRMLEGVSEWVSSEKEIQFLIDYISERGLMETEKTIMLQNIFELGRTPVKEIMVPATDIVSIDIDLTIQNVLSIFEKYHFTRLPIYDENKENIIGMVHLKDILLLLIKREEKPLRDIIRPILFVPESLKVNQLLRELRQKHRHLAIVLNEHGIVTGLITLEDVLEEIVGEISDEHERITEKIIKLREGGWLIEAIVPLEDVTKLLNITFETESAVTLGGFLTEKLQHLPKKGERLLYKGYYFQVQQATPKRVLQVLVFEE